MNTKKTIKNVAISFHNFYEEEAKIIGWKTQKSCQVKFKDLPTKNQTLMLAVAEKILQIQDWAIAKAKLKMMKEIFVELNKFSCIKNNKKYLEFKEKKKADLKKCFLELKKELEEEKR